MDEIRETALPYRNGNYTYRDYANLPEGPRYQLIGGDLVLAPSPTPYHQDVSSNLNRLMDRFVLQNDMGIVRYAPLDVYLNEKETYQPDIIYIARDRLGIKGKKKIEGAPDLVVEILSPSTAYDDLTTKFRNYEKYGVKEYWVVDPEEKSVEIFVATGGRLLSNQQVAGQGTIASNVLVGFTVDLENVFSSPE
ncbi:MAG TPA: Uma2 family endonuclease [Spirochaetia bacterium]|nr:Uma2 family endonuclease [Spirochaetia bacterium]